MEELGDKNRVKGEMEMDMREDFEIGRGKYWNREETMVRVIS